jgi:putative endonuclease
MTADATPLARFGEQEAAAFLKKQGYRILERNYRCVFAEVDIIAKERGVICFIEVKTRSSQAFGHPAEAITRAKRRHIARAALAYLQKNKLLDAPARFDVVAVQRKENAWSVENE